MKVLAFFDFDATVRHFVLSGALDDLAREHELKLVFHRDTTSEKQGIYADIASLGLSNWTWFDLPRFRMGSWDQLYMIVALHNHRGSESFGLRKSLVAHGRGWLRAHLYHLLAMPGLYPFARRHYLRKMGLYEPLRRFVEEEKPDLIVHPSLLSGYFVNELLQIKETMGIPLLLLMNSWDNPSSKAMNTGHPTKLAVWGPQSAEHAVQYLKIPPEDIEQLGAAQFEVYREPVSESEDELREMFAVPAGKHIILYAGTSKSGNDSRHLVALDEAIADGRLADCHVIYRPHPWRAALVENEQDFFTLNLQNVSIDPHMVDFYRRAIVGETKGFYLADYTVTRKLLELVSGVISPMSTLLLEAAIVGKPSIMFFPDAAKETAIHNYVLRVGTRMPHFKDFLGPDGIQIVHREEQLPEACTRLVGELQSTAIADDLRRHAARFVNPDGPPYRTKLLQLAEDMAPFRRPEMAS